MPQYYDIIPRENARDLTTIQRNLAQDRYATIEAVEADVHLMIDNCLTFNDAASAVAISGQETEALFQVAFEKIKSESAKTSGGTKRGGKESGGSVKKAKYV